MELRFEKSENIKGFFTNIGTFNLEFLKYKQAYWLDYGYVKICHKL